MVIQSRAERSRGAALSAQDPGMGHSSLKPQESLCKAAPPVQVGWEFHRGTSQEKLLHTHYAMGNAKAVLKIITDGLHASKDYWYVNVIVLIRVSHPATPNASNKDFSPYPQTDDVHPASAGHTFFICCQF